MLQSISMEEGIPSNLSEEKKKEELISSPHVPMPPAISILTILVLILLFYALLSGETYRFYASFLFLFYSLIGKMWLSVICLGAFQTLILVPFRIVNLRRSLHIKEFIEGIEGVEIKKTQRLLLKKNIQEGNVNLLWYMVNFTAQTIAYFSLGRLFLTDFYTQALDPKLLYSFVPYPDYPIKDIFFKIPYISFTETRDYGIGLVLVVWLALFIYKILVSRFIKYYQRRVREAKVKAEDKQPFTFVKGLIKYSSGSVILFAVLAWIVIRHYPVAWEFAIFIGDVSRPNRTLNTITAIMTAFIIVWLDLPKIAHKITLARQSGVTEKVIMKTQKDLYKHTFQKAIFLGLGAYFITNLIPSAFELSVFTLEIISLISPFTLDKFVLNIPKKA